MMERFTLAQAAEWTGGKAHGAASVSYTHLDVYKRQILRCMAAALPDLSLQKS